jgi:hypothetical protein
VQRDVARSDESLRDTVRLRRTETLIELNVLVNDFSEPTTEPSDWHADEPKMDNWMDDHGHDLDHITIDVWGPLRPGRAVPRGVVEVGL